MQLLRRMHEESGPMVGAFSEQKVRAAVLACLNEGSIILALHDGNVVGCMGIVPEQPWWSEDWRLGERFTYVHPDFRRSRHARNMLKTACAAVAHIAKDGQPISLWAGVYSDVDHERKCALFGRIMAKVGEVFIYKP